MAHEVFISHSSLDKPIADAACAALENGGIRCWIAPRDVQPGRSFAGEINRAIQHSKVMVLVFSTHSNTSEQILREVQLAANSHLHIVQFRIEDVVPNEDLEYYLSTPHWLDALTPPLESNLRRLATSIKALLEMAAEEPGKASGNIVLPRAESMAQKPDDSVSRKQGSNAEDFQGNAGVAQVRKTFIHRMLKPLGIVAIAICVAVLFVILLRQREAPERRKYVSTPKSQGTTASRAATNPYSLRNVTGAWSGSWHNTKGERGTTNIYLTEGTGGLITGYEPAVGEPTKIENGHRTGDRLTWEYHNIAGCRDYQVELKISADGNTMNGTYAVTDRCANTTYNGSYDNYERR